jgi:hypothetical protein
MIYTLTQAILAVLNNVSEIKLVLPYPPGDEYSFDTYPAVIVLQDSFDNAFETNVENAKDYTFRMWIVIGCGGDTVENVWTVALPKAIDAVVAAFDAAWNGGTIDGHRIRYLISNGASSMVVAGDGREAVAELALSIKVLTTN